MVILPISQQSLWGIEMSNVSKIAAQGTPLRQSIRHRHTEFMGHSCFEIYNFVK